MASTALVLASTRILRAQLDTANTNWDGTGTGFKTLYDASALGNWLIEWLHIIAQETTAAKQFIKFFTYDGTTRMLFDFVELPAVAISTGVRGPARVTLNPKDRGWLELGLQGGAGTDIDIEVVAETADDIIVIAGGGPF